ERKNLIEYAARSERSQTFEQRRHLPQVVDAAPTALVPEVAAKGVADNRVGAAASTEPHPIAGREHLLGDLLAVNERPVARAAVDEHPVVAASDDLRVFAGDLGTWQLQVVALAPADAERFAVADLQLDVAVPECVDDFQLHVSVFSRTDSRR